MSRRDIAWSFPSGFHALGSVVVDLKRAVVPTNVRHFGLSVYSELLDIRRAGLHGYAPFFLLSLLFFLSVSFLLSPLSLSLSLYLILPLVLFSLLLSLALSHTVDLLGGGSHRCTRQVFGQYVAPDFNWIPKDPQSACFTCHSIFLSHKTFILFFILNCFKWFCILILLFIFYS